MLRHEGLGQKVEIGNEKGKFVCGFVCDQEKGGVSGIDSYASKPEPFQPMPYQFANDGVIICYYGILQSTTRGALAPYPLWCLSPAVLLRLTPRQYFARPRGMLLLRTSFFVMLRGWISNSFGDQFYDKAMGCLVVLRKTCQKNDEAEAFNTWLRGL
ncbi:uncharacterized protein EV422DRAFT_131268 [Fimicolochytrium jonesii]|uniref:uncharacterized protein n=1 Tax=Fimicolochytrium jonesii TaxID=1396493 RepID=UPI0022FF04E1|nr:uncharacterized protein EV422DRAFT_131268 [Fimicolochytrium jonesii]KAI8819056.1 hypothetical protein EV422DRAFT_131268 [Fimicolochytrium jonesii]